MQLQWELQAVPRVGEITGTSGKGLWPGINPLSEKGDGELHHWLGVASPLETL